MSIMTPSVLNDLNDGFLDIPDRLQKFGAWFRQEFKAADTLPHFDIEKDQEVDPPSTLPVITSTFDSLVRGFSCEKCSPQVGRWSAQTTGLLPHGVPYLSWI
jgi:hypothetical protein